MEYKMVTIPFDLETAKKINIGERVGQIVTEKGRNRAEIVYEDNSSICPLLVVIHSISVSADWFSAGLTEDECRKLQEESGSFNDEMLEFIDIVFGHTDMIGEGEDDTE